MLRRALIIGISEYSQNCLPNATLDGRRVQEALVARKFECIYLEDCSEAQFKDALVKFSEGLAATDLALIYFAGHGVEYHGAGYVLPVDFPFPISPSGLRHYGIPIAELVDAMQEAGGAKVLVLDACRNWPVPSTGGSFLAQLDDQRAQESNWDNILIAYSTSASDIALDGVEGQSSRFCNAFSATLLRHDLSLDDCFREVGKSVLRESGRLQRPWSYSSLNASGSFSDLPRFSLLQCYPIPASGYSTLTLSLGRKGRSVLISGRSTITSEAAISSIRTSRYASEPLISSAFSPRRGVIVLGESGKLWLPAGKSLEIGMPKADGMASSRDGSLLAVYGGNGFKILRDLGDVFDVVAEVETTWSVHTCIFFENSDEIWFGGQDGNIYVVSLRGGFVEISKTTITRNHIYSMSVIGRNKIACVGSSGFVATLDRRSRILSEIYCMPPEIRTPSARRSALVGVMDDKHIERMVFYPETIPIHIRRRFSEHSQSNDILSCSSAPNLPILAVASNEGIVSFIDLRDGQIFQEIDTEAGRAQDTQAICFTKNGVLAVVTKDATVGFYAPKVPGKSPSGPFLRTEQEDLDWFGDPEGDVS